MRNTICCLCCDHSSDRSIRSQSWSLRSVVVNIESHCSSHLTLTLLYEHTHTITTINATNTHFASLEHFFFLSWPDYSKTSTFYSHPHVFCVEAILPILLHFFVAVSNLLFLAPLFSPFNTTLNLNFMMITMMMQHYYSISHHKTFVIKINILIIIHHWNEINVGCAQLMLHTRYQHFNILKKN